MIHGKHRLQTDSLVESVHVNERDPKLTTLLASAGLTAVDLQLFDHLHLHGHSVFVHGSIVENRITPGSDIDLPLLED